MQDLIKLLIRVYGIEYAETAYEMACFVIMSFLPAFYLIKLIYSYVNKYIICTLSHYFKIVKSIFLQDKNHFAIRVFVFIFLFFMMKIFINSVYDNTGRMRGGGQYKIWHYIMMAADIPDD